MKKIDSTILNQMIDSDEIFIIYNTHGYGVYLVCSVLTNHSMSIDDCIDLCGVDMDAEAERLDWDGWDYDELEMIYNVNDIKNLI